MKQKRSIFHFLPQLKNRKWKMDVHFQFSIFQAQWKMKLTVCTRIALPKTPRQRSPRPPIAEFNGPTSKGRTGREEGEGKGRGGEYNVSRMLAVACWQP